MKKKISALLFLLFFTSKFYAQEIKLFQISLDNEKSVFISLSDIYPASEHPDSLVVSVKNTSSAYFKLDTKFRKRFLSKTKIYETDKVFLYDYSKNKLVSFPVKNLDIVANLSLYETGEETPHSQFDYMIGFELDKNSIKEIVSNVGSILVYVGKENPFAEKQLTAITWKKISSKDFPKDRIKDEFDEHPEINSFGESYFFEFENVQYFIQDLKNENSTFGRRLLVLNSKTKKVIHQEIFREGESDSLAPLNFLNNEDDVNQWTGKLFKNKEAVIFGFEYHSFGCAEITILGKKPTQIGIYCDNRH